MANDRIKELFTATGMKRNDLAAVLGVDPSTLRRWSYGETNPPAEKLAELERLAGGGPVLPVPQKQRPNASLADIPSSALIEELARRSRGGILRDVPPAVAPETRKLRSVAFRDVQDD